VNGIIRGWARTDMMERKVACGAIEG